MTEANNLGELQAQAAALVMEVRSMHDAEPTPENEARLDDIERRLSVLMLQISDAIGGSDGT